MDKDTHLNPHTREPKAFPSFSKPKIVGSFSVDKDRKYIADARNCKHLRKDNLKNPVRFDLNDGYERAVHKPESCDEKLDHILQWITANVLDKNLNEMPKKGEPNIRARSLDVDFVCFRGLLRMIMCTPYENREPWIILATKFRGTIYLCALETESKKLDRLNATEDTKKILAFGYKFEQFMLTDDPLEPPNTDEPVIESEEFCCMFETNLNGTKLLYGAEMDGVDSNTKCDFNRTDLNELNFIELKCTLRPVHERQKINYRRYKLRNWWCQCFLARIEKIVVGTRNQKGTVDELSELEVSNIPRLVRDKNYWSPSVCMTFCDKFLHMVARHMDGIDDPETVIRFEYNPSRETTIKSKLYSNVNPFTFLPASYIEKLSSIG